MNNSSGMKGGSTPPSGHAQTEGLNLLRSIEGGVRELSLAERHAAAERGKRGAGSSQGIVSPFDRQQRDTTNLLGNLSSYLKNVDLVNSMKDVSNKLDEQAPQRQGYVRRHWKLDGCIR